MPALDAAELFNFTNAFEQLCESFALSMSESLSQLVTTETPVVRVDTVDAILGGSKTVLSTTFTLPLLQQDDCILSFAIDDAPVLLGLVTGNTAAQATLPLSDDQVTQLGLACSGMVNGLATAIGNARSMPIQVGSCVTHQESLNLPPLYATVGEVVVVELPFSVDGVIDGQLTFYMTPEFARALSPEADTKAASAPQAGFGGFQPINPGLENAGLPPGVNPFGNFDSFAPQSDTLPTNMDMIMDIPLDVVVELGRVRMLIKDVLGLSNGSIVELERVAGEPVDLLVNGRLVAKGEVVVIDDNFGIRITEIMSQGDRLASLKNKG